MKNLSPRPQLSGLSFSGPSPVPKDTEFTGLESRVRQEEDSGSDPGWVTQGGDREGGGTVSDEVDDVRLVGLVDL